MIVEKQDVDFCKSRVKVSYDSDKVTETVNSIAKEVAKKVKLSGFRHKAPVDAVKIAAYKIIVEHLKEKLISEAV